MSKITSIVKNPLLVGGLVMVIGSNIFNITQFIYHFVAGRMLGKSLYGDFASLISIIGIVGIIQISLGLTIIKFVASESDKKNVKNLVQWFNRWSIWSGAIVAILGFLFAPIIAEFLKISDLRAIYVLSLMLLFFVILNVQRAVLQGLLKFDKYVISLFAEAVIKIFLTIALVYLGFAVFGAMIAFLLAVLLSFTSTNLSLISHLKGKLGPRPDFLPLFKYSLPVFVQGVALTSMYSTDLLLVKHFFSSAEAGLYASLAVLGRVALFSATPVTQAMFPIIAGKYSRGEAYNRIFYSSFFAVLAISLPVVIFYKLLPEIPVGVLYGKEYIDGAPILWLFGLFMALLSLAMLMTQFYLSVGKTKIVWLFMGAAVLQAGLIWVIHPNLETVIKLSILCASLLCLSLLIYFPYHKK